MQDDGAGNLLIILVTEYLNTALVSLALTGIPPGKPFPSTLLLKNDMLDNSAATSVHRKIWFAYPLDCE